MASKFQQYKDETGTTPLPTFIDTALFDITKNLAAKQEITHATWVRRAITAAVNEQGVDYTYPEKLSLQDELAKVKAELAAIKASVPSEKKVIVPTAPGVMANPLTGEIEEVEDEEEDIDEEDD